MSVENSTYPKFKYTIASTGQPGVGYKLFTYEEGTSTKKTTWTSAAKTATNTNPIILDANGEADVWIDGNYKLVLAPPTDTDPPTSAIWTYDAIRSPLDSTTGTTAAINTPFNGSFENDTDADGVPDNWTVVAYTGGSVDLDTASTTHGSASLKFTSVGGGGGSAVTDDFYEVEAGKAIGVHFSIISANADTLNKVQVNWYNASQVFLSTSDAYNEGAANPTTWTRQDTTVTAPATAKYAKVVLVGVDPLSTTHSSTNFDNVKLDTSFFGGVTATPIELNILDGATVTTAEVNHLSGVTSNIQTQLNERVWSLLETWTPTVTASHDFTWDETVYSNIQVVFEGIVPGTDGDTLLAQFGHSDGATVIATANYDTTNTSTVGTTVSNTANAIGVYIAPLVGSAANEGCSGTFELIGFNSTVSPKLARGNTASVSSAGTYSGSDFVGILDNNAGTAFDTVRLTWFTGGNFAAVGTVYFYGLKRVTN